MNAAPLPPPDPGIQVRERMIRDLIAGERALKEAALDAVHRFRGVLVWLARRLDGERVQDLLHADPAAFLAWPPEQWEAFFAELLRERPWGSSTPPPDLERLEKDNANLLKNSEHWRQRSQRLERQLAEANTHLARLEAQARLSATRPPAATPVPDAGLALSGPYLAILDQLRAWSTPTRPVRFQTQVSSESVQWRRQSLALFILASYGISARIELDHLVAIVEGLKSRPSSLRNALDLLTNRGLVQADVLRIERGEFRSSLAVMRLSEDGGQLCRALGWEPVEGEWERVIRGHEGARFPEHTLGILALAMHARLRGWQVQVLPEVAGPAAPDLLIERAKDHLYVEVELSEKEHLEKWRNLAALQGRVALCAATKAQRQTLAADCRRLKFPGQAADLETLAAMRLSEILPASSLWAETW